MASNRGNYYPYKTKSMKTQILLSVVFLFFASMHHHVLRHVSAIDNNSSDYIRLSCESTLYPDTCYNSLSRYGSVVQQDPQRLALVATGVSLDKAKCVTVYLSNLSREADFGEQPRVGAALHDCLSVFRDAASQMRESLNQMRTLSSGESLRFQMSSVQTWMSAALTNEDTCTDGFDGVPEGPFKSDVSNRAAEVKEVTSNALALINSYANNIS